MSNPQTLLQKWRRDPVEFMQACINPETDTPFVLYEEQRTFARKALTVTAEGTLPYPELLFSAPKKSGKTAFGALVALYIITVLGGKYAEGYCLANDEEQAQGRVFQAMARIVAATPFLAEMCSVTKDRIVFIHDGSVVQALANDFAGAAGANPNVSVFDELWAFTSERSHRLWDEMCVPPTRRAACRLTTTYAGFEGESKLLEDLYKRAIAADKVGTDLYEIPGQLLAYWTHTFRAPWQSEAWREQMRTQLRPTAFTRLVENRFTSGESLFLDDIGWWDRAATGRPVLLDKSLVVSMGVDAGLKRDHAAVVATCYDHATGRVRLVAHRIFRPTAEDQLDLEDTLEETVKDFAKRFHVRDVRFDPWQFARSAQTLAKAGIHMVEFPQSIPNLTAMSSNLYELFKGSNIEVYEDAELKLAMQRAVAVESSRGMKIAKEKTSHKIDSVVALAMAALGAVSTPKPQETVKIDLNLKVGRKAPSFQIR